MQRAVVSSGESIEVAVGQFGSVIGCGLLQILGKDAGLRVVDDGLDRAALEAVVARGGAQVVVLDEDSGVAPGLVRALCNGPPGGSHLPEGLHHPGVGLVVLAHRPTRAFARRMLALGVSVCLSMDEPAPEIVRAVRLAADGRHMFVSMSPHPARAWRAVGMSAALTRRERDVLELLSKGRTNPEIAHALCISVGTTRIHVKHVYRKLGVSSRGELLGMEL